MRCVVRWILVALVVLATVGCGPMPPSDPAQQAVAADLAERYGSNPLKIQQWFPVKKEGGETIVRVKYEVDLSPWVQRDETYFIKAGKVDRRSSTKSLKQ